ncbi:MAG: hypothetical protein LBH14_04060 [Desulfobulbaceae bacterium]|jgi:hypothetical protein|nr:hypothetical protein [Desulfobulbaceae bacterium]
MTNLIATWGKGNCTLWWDRIWGMEIGDVCYDHDAAYDAGAVYLKVRGDWRLVAAIWQRAGRCDEAWRTVAVRVTAIAMGLAVATAGWFWWWRVYRQWEDV